MSNTWSFKHAVTCNTPITFAWEFWTNVSNWKKIEGESVEWIKLDGPFEIGAIGTTKTPGQEAHSWKITALSPGSSATIEIQLDGAVFNNQMTFSQVDNETRITQELSLVGPNASMYEEGMKMFESTAPDGLAKLAKTIEGTFSEKHLSNL